MVIVLCFVILVVYYYIYGYYEVYIRDQIRHLISEIIHGLCHNEDLGNDVVDLIVVQQNENHFVIIIVFPMCYVIHDNCNTIWEKDKSICFYYCNYFKVNVKDLSINHIIIEHYYKKRYSQN